jgi:hypothetical protein
MCKKEIPLRRGLWVSSSTGDKKPQLMGSKCPNCGEIYFPKREKNICINCQYNGMEEVRLSRKGKIYSYTIVMQKPPGYYKGPVPYALAWVELPDGVRFETLLTNCDFENIKVGMDVELVIEKLHDDECGNQILTYKFKPDSD